jgi:hypothetical protein
MWINEDTDGPTRGQILREQVGPDPEPTPEGDLWDGPPVVAEGGVRCGACKARHPRTTDVRWCYRLRDEARAEAEAEQAAEAAAEVAYARDREAMAERGTWFGPVTEADSWGEEDN